MDPKELAMALMKRDLALRPEVAHQLAVNILTPKPPAGSAAASWHADAKDWHGAQTADRLYPRETPPVLAELSNSAIVGTDARNAVAGVLDQEGSAAFSRGFGTGQEKAQNDAYDIAHGRVNNQAAVDRYEFVNDGPPRAAVPDPAWDNHMFEGPVKMQLPQSEREQALAILKQRDQMIKGGGGTVPAQDETELKRQRVAKYHELMAKHHSGKAISEQERGWLDQVHAASKGQR